MSRPLRVLSWAGRWGWALEEAVSRPFTEATGVEVVPVRHVGLRLPEPLTRALERGQPAPIDVVWCNTTAALGAADQGWCASLDGLPVLGELHARAQPEGRSDWPFVKAYAVHYVLVYRRSLFPGAPPRSWSVLFRPEHQGKVVLYPGGKGFFPIAQTLGGGRVEDLPGEMTPCWSALQRLGPQLGKADYSVGLGSLFERGEIDLCYRALPNALGFQAEGVDVGWTAPDEGVADTTDALWIPNGLDDEADRQARRFVAFALSAPVQQRWCELLGALPMHPRAPVPAALREGWRVLSVPESVEAKHEPEWQRAFEAVTHAPAAQ